MGPRGTFPRVGQYFRDSETETQREAHGTVSIEWYTKYKIQCSGKIVSNRGPQIKFMRAELPNMRP